MNILKIWNIKYENPASFLIQLNLCFLGLLKLGDRIPPRSKKLLYLRREYETYLLYKVLWEEYVPPPYVFHNVIIFADKSIFSLKNFL